jgi:hypothetical protein
MELKVSTYEVLVPALQPIRYAVSDTLQHPEIPRMARQATVLPVEGLQRLKYFLTFCNDCAC